MIVYAKPVLFWVVLLLNCPAVRPFPLIFTSILSSLNGVETLQCYKSRRPYKYNHPCKYGTCWLQSTEGISWYHILGAKLCLSNTNIRIKNVHVCQLVERMTLCMCACLDTRALVFGISTSTWSHTWMSLFVNRWMHFPWFSTYTDRTGTVCNAVVHAAMPHLATSIITSSWCRSTNVRRASAPLDVCQSSSSERDGRWGPSRRKSVQRETRWKCFDCQAWAVWYNSNLNP